MIKKGTADLKNHKSAGNYSIHVYGVKNGKKEFVANTSIYVEKTAMSIPSVSAVVSEDCSSMTVTLKDADNYDSVHFPTWSNENGQDDIVWYAGQKNVDGTWTYTVDLKNHNSAGYYSIHVYGEKNGDTQLIANTSVYVEKTAMKLPSVSAVVSEDCSSMTVTLKNADNYDTVHFPIWSNENGQDDIVWYAAQENVDGTWTYTVDLKNHNSAGYYSIHFYGEKNGDMKLIAYTSAYVEI